MKNPPLRKIEFIENKISTKFSTEELRRKKIYLIALIIYVLVAIITILFSDRRYSFFIFIAIGVSLVLFQFFYPTEKKNREVRINDSIVKRKSAIFPFKSNFPLSEISGLEITRSTETIGNTVWINYGSEQNRYLLMDYLNLDDAEKVKDWVEGKLNQIK